MFDSWIGIAAAFVIVVILVITQHKKISKTAGKHFSPARFLIIFAVLLVILALLGKRLQIDDSKSVILYVLPWLIIVPIAIFAYIKTSKTPGMKRLQLIKLIVFLVGILCVILLASVPPTARSLTVIRILASAALLAFLTVFVLSFMR